MRCEGMRVRGYEGIRVCCEGIRVCCEGIRVCCEGML